MTSEKPKVVVITGPTASGKSSLAIEVALYFGGEIVNADSMQVYRGMDVGTAKPPLSERRGVPHYLLDVVDPDEDFNAAIYRSMAIPLLRECASRGKLCFVVGGCEELGPAHLHERLERLDPESAHKIHQNDKVRIIRALEIIHLTDQPLSSLIQGHGFRDQPFQTLKICLHMDREQLYHRINGRSLAMIEGGLVTETKALLGKGYSPDLKPMKSLGYRHMVEFLKGACAMDEAIYQLQTDTRRYAKRQLTWFKADSEMVWMRPEDLDGMIKNIKEFATDTP
jgi:tRNA dimethylallyltransferase